MTAYLEQIDFILFKALHLGTANALFDILMPIIRNKFTWIPLYLLFIYFAAKRYGWKSLYLIGGLALCILLADQFSANLVKHWAQRLRPCNDARLADIVRPLVSCGSGYSFISAHATNHFAIALIFTWLGRQYSTRQIFRWVFYTWATLICYAQVYVGVHFPFDVLVGAIAGLIIAKLLLMLILKFRLIK